MSAIVGIAGLDTLGRAIGERLRSAGLRVLGFDHDVQAAALSGLRTVGSAERLAQECEIEVVTRDGEQAIAFIDGLLEFSDLKQLSTIVLCGVLEPRRVKLLADAALAKDIDLVDAPFDGGEEAIQASRAVIFASGARAAVDRCSPLFQAFGRSVYVGDAGSGQVARIVNTLLTWSNMLAINDVFGLAVACGADAASIREAVLAASGSTRALETWGRGWSDPAADFAVAATLAQDAAASLPFLQDVGRLAAMLDIGKLQGMFNLGIADLSQSEPEDALPGAPQDAPQTSTAEGDAFSEEHEASALDDSEAESIDVAEAQAERPLS